MAPSSILSISALALTPIAVAFLAPGTPRCRSCRASFQTASSLAENAHADNEKPLTVPWRPRPDSVSNWEDMAEDDQFEMGLAEHSVVMMRHGESLFNQHNVFTGWCDVPLTKAGEQEARRAGEVLASHGLQFDVVFTSKLQRSTVTAYRCLEGASQSHVEVRPRWELNERHYGGLQGLSKDSVAATTDPATYQRWRQGYHDRPPPMAPGHKHWALMTQDPRYTELLESGQLPLTESIADTAVRVMRLWKDEIAPLVKQGKRVLIVGHRNSLRALIRNLEGLDDKSVAKMQIPTGAPFLYPLQADLRPVAPPLACPLGDPGDDDFLTQVGASGCGPSSSRALKGGGQLEAELAAAEGARSELMQKLETAMALTSSQAAKKRGQPKSGCGFQGVFLTDDQCTDAWSQAKSRCLAEWVADPANPPPECFKLNSDGECDVSHDW